MKGKKKSLFPFQPCTLPLYFKLLTLIFGLGSITCLAQNSTFTGQVIDVAGNPVPGVLLWSEQLDTVVYTNTNGQYLLPVVTGSPLVHFQKNGFRGYSLRWNEVPPQVKLSRQLDTSRLSADSLLGLLEKRYAENQKNYRAYQTQTFMKSEAFINSTPIEIWPAAGNLYPAKTDTGLVYSSESWREQKYLDRFHFSEKVLLKREAGAITAENWYYLPTYHWSFFEDKVYFQGIFNRGFYSPLFPGAFKLYRYQVLGSYPLNGHRVYRLAFWPAHTLAPLFKGTVDLVDSLWLPLHANFHVAPDSPLELLDSVQVSQYFSFQNGQYRKARQKVFFNLKVLNLRAAYAIDQFHYNFRFSDTINEEDFGSLAYQQLESAFKPDTSFWHDKKPAALGNYGSNFKTKGLQLKKAMRRFYLGSRLTKRSTNYYNWFIQGHLYDTANFYLGKPPLYYALGFNPVEGIYLNYSFPLGLSYPRYEWQLSPQLRYGFADNKLKPSAQLSLSFDPESPKVLALAGGQQYRQFNIDEPILPVVNSLYSLFLGKNLIKLYGRNFLQASYSFEIFNGLSVNTSLEYAQRFQLFNNTDFTLFDRQNEYEGNNTFRANPVASEDFERHRALNFNLGLSYQFNQLYELRHRQYLHRKVQLRNNLPVEKPFIYYNLRAGIATNFSETNFLYQNIGFKYLFRIGNAGNSTMDLSTGHFVYQGFVPFMDYKHFDGIQLFFLQPTPSSRNRIKQFGTLPYYGYSTTQPYLELHYEHFFEGFLLSRIDFFRKAQVHLTTGTHALWLADERYFVEGVVGLSNILKIMRLEYSFGAGENLSLQHTIRLSFDLNYIYYRNNQVD